MKEVTNQPPVYEVYQVSDFDVESGIASTYPVYVYPGQTIAGQEVLVAEIRLPDGHPNKEMDVFYILVRLTRSAREGLAIDSYDIPGLLVTDESPVLGIVFIGGENDIYESQGQAEAGLADMAANPEHYPYLTPPAKR